MVPGSDSNFQHTLKKRLGISKDDQAYKHAKPMNNKIGIITVSV